MKKWLESLLLALLAFAPSVLAILSMHQYGQFGVSCALVLSGIYLLVLATVLSTRCCRQQITSRSERDHLQEAPIMDSPPAYEVVVAKPPPYHLLYGNDVASGDFTPSSAHGKYDCAPVHTSSKPTGGEGGCGKATVSYTWVESACEDDDDDRGLPSYSEAVDSSVPCIGPRDTSQLRDSSSFYIRPNDTSPLPE